MSAALARSAASTRPVLATSPPDPRELADPARSGEAKLVAAFVATCIVHDVDSSLEIGQLQSAFGRWLKQHGQRVGAPRRDVFSIFDGHLGPRWRCAGRTRWPGWSLRDETAGALRRTRSR